MRSSRVKSRHYDIKSEFGPLLDSYAVVFGLIIRPNSCNEPVTIIVMPLAHGPPIGPAEA